jgi:hypothetical protein
MAALQGSGQGCLGGIQQPVLKRGVCAPAPVQRRNRAARLPLRAVGLGDLSASVVSIVDSLSSLAPATLQPVVSTIGGDVASLVAGAPTIPAIGRLLVSTTGLLSGEMRLVP